LKYCIPSDEPSSWVEKCKNLPNLHESTKSYKVLFSLWEISFKRLKNHHRHFYSKYQDASLVEHLHGISFFDALTLFTIDRYVFGAIFENIILPRLVSYLLKSMRNWDGKIHQWMEKSINSTMEDPLTNDDQFTMCLIAMQSLQKFQNQSAFPRIIHVIVHYIYVYCIRRTVAGG